MMRGGKVIRYHNSHHCQHRLLLPLSLPTSWYSNSNTNNIKYNNDNSMSQRRIISTVTTTTTTTRTRQQQQQCRRHLFSNEQQQLHDHDNNPKATKLVSSPLLYSINDMKNMKHHQHPLSSLSLFRYYSVHANANDNNNSNNNNNNDSTTKIKSSSSSSSNVITMISPSYQCSQEMIYHIQNLIHNINNDATTATTTTNTQNNDCINIKILPKSIINIGTFQWDSIGIKFVNRNNNDDNNINNTNKTRTILHWLSLHTKNNTATNFTTSNTITTTTTTSNNKKVQQLPTMELLSIHGNVSNLSTIYDMLSSNDEDHVVNTNDNLMKDTIRSSYYDTILLSFIQYRILLKQLYDNIIIQTITTRYEVNQQPKHLKEYLLRNYNHNNNTKQKTIQLPYILVDFKNDVTTTTNDNVNVNNHNHDDASWDYGILKEIVIPVLDTFHYEQLVSSLHKVSTSLFHRPIPGIYQTISTASNNNDKTNNNNSGGLCIRPIPMAYEDRSISPITFIFHIPSASSTSSLFSGNDGNDNQTKKTPYYNYQRIGFTGGGIKNNHGGIGQYLIRNDPTTTTNHYFGGYDIRLCSNPNISSIFHEAQQSLLASSINELQSTHVLGGEISNNNNNNNNNNSSSSGGKISVHKAISATRTPTKSLNDNADTKEEEQKNKQDGGGDCWQEFRVTMKHNPLQYLPKRQPSSSTTSSTGNYSLSEYSIGSNTNNKER